MKVLYILAHFPQNSESYVDAEISYVLERGIKVEVWSPVSGYGDDPVVKVHRGSISSAIHSFLPDVIHIHHMTTASSYIDQCPRDRVTIRAHSFDWDSKLLLKLIKHPAVRKIFAFPHFAALVPGVGPLSVAYDPKRYYRCEDKDRRSVVRVAACLPTKRLEDFILVGNRLGNDADFTLALNLAHSKESVFDQMVDYNRKNGGRVRIVKNRSKDGVAELVRRAGIYMSTANAAAHPFGNPISIAEAMATGAVVIARADGKVVSDYLGRGDLLYSTLDEAEALIRTVLAFQQAEWTAAAVTSVMNAARFRSDIVLPRLVEEWNRICLDHF